MKQLTDEWTPTGNTPTILVKGQRWRHGETLVIVTDAEPLADGRISAKLLVSADIKELPSLGHDGWKFCGIHSTVPEVEVGHTIESRRPNARSCNSTPIELLPRDPRWGKDGYE